MSRIAYVNGRYLPHRRAAVHVEDRGYQFADGVYEVIAVRGGRLIDGEVHFERLVRSLAELSIPEPMGNRALRHVIMEVIRRNRVRDGMVYLQVTRGAAPRDHPFPARAVPALVVTAKSLPVAPSALEAAGCAVITVPDQRWKRCDIKSISLLPNVLAKQRARASGAHEALLVGPDGVVTEGSSTNVWIVTAAGVLVTAPAGPGILSGVTRRAVIALARDAGLSFEERGFSVDEAKASAEAFLTSSTAFIVPVVRIDGADLGDGRPGPFTVRLIAAYRDYVARLGAGVPA